VSRSDVSAEDHAARVADVIAFIPDVEAARNELREVLDGVFEAIDPLECLALSSAVYLTKDPDTYSEADDDRSPAHLEFLTLSALGFLQSAGNGGVEQRDGSPETTGQRAVAASEETCAGPDHHAAETDDTGTADDDLARDTATRYWKGRAVDKAMREALGLVREMFNLSTNLLWMRSIDKANEPGADKGFEEFRREAQLQSLNIRGAAYLEHLSEVLHGVMEPFDSECRTLLGFTAAEAWSCSIAVGSLMSRRVAERAHAMQHDYEAVLAQVRRLRRRNSLPSHLLSLTPTQQKAWVAARVQYEHFAEPLTLLTITAAQLSAETQARVEDESGGEFRGAEQGRLGPFVEVDETAALAWLTAFTCDPAEFEARVHRLPCGGHPVTRLPVLKVRHGFLVPCPTSLFEALRPRMEDALHSQPGLWDRYDHHRATWVEKAATDRLASALPGSRSWTGIGWASPEDDSDVDGLVGCDDFAARLQCKAGRISPPARRGAPSMAEDIQAVINSAAQQHERLADALALHDGSALGFTTQQVDVLGAGLTVEVVVCLDDVTVWSTETHKLRRLVSLPNTPQLPWVLSLTDLMAVTDVLQGAQLVHYVTRRLRLENEGRVSAHDELDWLGNYINDGLFFDDHFEREDAPDVVRLLSYTGQFDSWYFSRAGMTTRTVARPAQPIPRSLRDLLDRLSRDRPPHWLTASLLLLNGDDEVRGNIAQIMQHTRARADAVGWSTGVQVYADYSLALTVNRMNSGKALVRAMRAYWEDKTRPLGRPNAVSIGLGSDGRLVVDLIETDPTLTIAHVLMSRQPPRSEDERSAMRTPD
jgi:hypothetical protein